MAGNILFQSGGISYALQTSGNGVQVANAAASACSGPATGYIDNTGASGGPRFWGLVEFFAAKSGWGGNVNAGSTIDLYLVPSRDGTKFADVDIAGATLPANHYVGSFVVTKSGNNQASLMIPAIPLLPVLYQPYIVNNLGQNITSGWAMTMSTFDESYT